VPTKRLTEADRARRLAERQDAASDASSTGEGLGVPSDSEDALQELLAALRANWVEYGREGSEARKLTLPLAERVVTWVAEGLAPRRALSGMPVSASTIERWTKLGSDGVEPYRSFLEAIARAKVIAERSLLAVVRRHAIDDPKLALRMLEILDPDRYGPPKRTSDEGGNVRPQFSGATVTSAKALPPLAEYEETMG
jgi:hypothetical protein